MSDLETIAAKVADAKCPEDVFGALTADELGQRYRQIIQTVHPDRFQGNAAELEIATAAFRRVTELHAAAQRKFEAGTYGDRTMPVAPAPAPGPRPPVTVKVHGKQYVVGEVLATGDIADVYRCDGSGAPAVLKVAQRSADNDLLDNEWRVLAKLFPASAKSEFYERYLPRLYDSFLLRGKSLRRANVIELYAEHVSLALVKSWYPHGLDFRDVTWMFKRMLEGLGWIHRQGVVHGALLPEHVLVHPVEHGAKILDWCYAVELGKGHVRAISAAHRRRYPPEVFEKRAATPALDIFMAAGLALDLMRGSNGTPATIPAPIERFFEACLIPSPARRPQDAWQLLDEYKELLLKLVGKPKYRKLHVPEDAR